MKKIFLVLTLLISGFGFAETYIGCRLDKDTLIKDQRLYLEKYPSDYYNLFVVIYSKEKLGIVNLQYDLYNDDSGLFIGINEDDKDEDIGRFTDEELIFGINSMTINRETLEWKLRKQRGQCSLIDKSEFFKQRKEIQEILLKGKQI